MHSPSSQSMKRNDSTIGDYKSPTSNALASPPSSENGNLAIFTPESTGLSGDDHWSTLPKKGVTFAANVPAFRPAGAAISFLNESSEPDDTRHTTANIGRPMRPIGSPTDTARTASLHDGPPFTTGTYPAATCSRFLVFGDIPKECMVDGFFKAVLINLGLMGQLISYAYGRKKSNVYETYLFFDDLRQAYAGERALATIFPNGTAKYITCEQYVSTDFEEYFPVDSNHLQRAHLSSPFDGQVQFVARYLGSARDSDLTAIFKTVKIYAETFGDVRTIALQEPCEVSTPLFRVEYFSLKCADAVCEPGEEKRSVRISDDVVVSITEVFPNYQQAPSLSALSPQPKPAPGHNLHEGFKNLSLQDQSSGAINRRGAMATRQQRPRQEILRDYAPEYRNRIPRTRPQPVPYSGILDNVNYEVLNASGPEDIVNQPQTIRLMEGGRNNDLRTTVMVRNIPNRMDAIDLKVWLDETSLGMYDFSYLRVDFSNNCNVGYAFVNFVHPDAIAHFLKHRMSKPWGLYGSEKTCEVSYATIQGQACLIEKFRNSSVMQEWEGFRPKMWYSVDCTDIPAGVKVGDQAPFPSPNNASKLQRSLDNAQAVGLYPPRHNHSHRGRDSHPGRRSQYDRGTPRALMEENAFNGNHGNPRFRPGQARMVVYVTEPNAAYQNNNFGNQQFRGGNFNRGGNFHRGGNNNNNSNNGRRRNNNYNVEY